MYCADSGLVPTARYHSYGNINYFLAIVYSPHAIFITINVLYILQEIQGLVCRRIRDALPHFDDVDGCLASSHAHQLYLVRWRYFSTI
jgi:hypothetical protein